MTQEAVVDFFQRYAEAFSRSDVDAVRELWSFPAFISTPQRDVVLDDRAFRENTEKLCAFYRRQNVARAEKTVESVHPLSADVVSVRTHDRLYDEAGELIADWHHGYLMRETSDGLRVNAAIADAELAAWHARGTPLGS